MRVVTAKHAFYETRICDEGIVLVQTAKHVLAAGETFFLKDAVEIYEPSAMMLRW